MAGDVAVACQRSKVQNIPSITEKKKLRPFPPMIVKDTHVTPKLCCWPLFQTRSHVSHDCLEGCNT
jgi:hypothetical protein